MQSFQSLTEQKAERIDQGFVGLHLRSFIQREIEQLDRRERSDPRPPPRSAEAFVRRPRLLAISTHLKLVVLARTGGGRATRSEHSLFFY